jgi:uncharacterized protein (DUF3820 family)
MSQLSERVTARVSGRNEAKALAGLVMLPTETHVEAFFEELYRILWPAKLEQQRTESLATLRDILKYPLEFGLHRGKTLDEVPRDYLHWLSENMETTKTRIDQYLAITKP